MHDKIKNYLQQLEAEKNIEIVLACETGSRAWGFPSPDSDYDVRIIYKHERNWYLSIHEKKDTIELMLENNDIDISGWDLRKSLRLLLKSNPALLERIQSPIIYMVDQPFIDEFTALANTAYSRIATIHHYLSLAKKCIDDLTQEPEYKLKRFFYGLRAATACLWILEKESMPPIVFQQMYNALNLPLTLVQRIDELIALKATKSEQYKHSGEEELIHFMIDSTQQAEEKAAALPAGKARLENFDQFLVDMLG